MTPEVSVLVPVYNTMPYLTACLDSLAGQSIGPERMEIIAVDDGSTDGGSAELDEFAERYPGTCRIIHQPNSGGPAQPGNQALELATGRYVHFVGSDDVLGTQALERLVAMADALDSDIVIGRMVGVNGRFVSQRLFTANQRDVGLFDSALPWSLSNAKLFRRALVERHRLRFPEDMAVCSDQPFTIEACLRAKRISVLADYPCYYAVRRVDGRNITYRTDPLTRLESFARLIKCTAGLIEAGPRRDAVLRRHFSWEVCNLLKGEFLELDGAVREKVCAGVGRLADLYLSDAVRDELDVWRRIRLSLAQRGAMAQLCEAIAEPRPPMRLECGRVYVRHPGFGDPSLGIPKARYEITGSLAKRVAEGLRTARVRWEDRSALALSLSTPFTDGEGLHVAAVPTRRPGRPRRVRALPEGAVPVPLPESIRFPVAELLGPHIRAIRLYVVTAEAIHEVPVPATKEPPPPLFMWRHGLPCRLSVDADEAGGLVVSTASIQVVGHFLRRLGRKPW